MAPTGRGHVGPRDQSSLEDLRRSRRAANPTCAGSPEFRTTTGFSRCATLQLRWSDEFPPAGGTADYIVTGAQSKAPGSEEDQRNRAGARAHGVGEFRRIPEPSEIPLDPAAAYVHFTSNETIPASSGAASPGRVRFRSSATPLRSSAARSTSPLRAPVRRRPENLGPSGVTLVSGGPARGSQRPSDDAHFDTHAKESRSTTPPPLWDLHDPADDEVAPCGGGPRAMARRNRGNLSTARSTPPAASTDAKPDASEHERDLPSPIRRAREAIRRGGEGGRPPGLAGCHRSVGGDARLIARARRRARSLVSFAGLPCAG